MSDAFEPQSGSTQSSSFGSVVVSFERSFLKNSSQRARSEGRGTACCASNECAMACVADVGG